VYTYEHACILIYIYINDAYKALAVMPLLVFQVEFHVCICIYIWRLVHVREYTDVCTYVWTCVFIYIYIYIKEACKALAAMPLLAFHVNFSCVYIYMCIYVSMYICMNLCLYFFFPPCVYLNICASTRRARRSLRYRCWCSRQTFYVYIYTYVYIYVYM